MKIPRIFIFSHNDLDGVVSALVTKWAHPQAHIEYDSIAGFGFRIDFTKWLLKHKIEDYDKIFILDLDVSDHKDLIDKSNVFIIDHHKSHVDNAKYETATVIVKEYPSACLLAYKIFKKLYNLELNKNQKILIALGNDYDSYTLSVPESKKLNSIFWSTHNNFKAFMEMYDKGMTAFTAQQENIYKLWKQQLDKTLANIKLFENKEISISGTKYHIIATFVNKSSPVNDISDHILSTYNPDIAIVVNTSTQHISFRRNKKSTCKLNLLAEKLADGAGHEYSAGGQITGKFLEFTKLLKEIK